MKERLIVDGVVPTAADDTNIRDECWSIALDQRAFGPRRLLVTFSDSAGRFLALAHAPRTEPIELALAACIDHLGRGAAAAIAFCDERVTEGPPGDGLAEKFAAARAVCGSYGVHLVDWIMCDDAQFRSVRLSLDPDCDWWDVPA